MDTNLPRSEAPNAVAGQKTAEASKPSAAPKKDAKEKAVADQKPDGGRPQVTVEGEQPAPPPLPEKPQTDATRKTTIIGPQETSVTNRGRENSHISADQFFALRNRLPIQIFNEETKLQKLAHWGPLVMGVASIVLTIFVWRNTEKLSSEQVALQAKQVELQDRQNQIQNDQVQAQLADLRFKFLNDLTATDENKKTPAEIGLAAHGLKAFPVVHYALGVEPGDIRKSAVNVVYRLFQAETKEGREELLNRLMGEFAFPNKNLHTGVVQSLLKVEPHLTPAQRAKVIDFLQEKLVPQTACAEQEGREAVFEAAKFIGSKRADAIQYLVSVVGVARCGDAWLQAMYNLENVAPEISGQERSNLREKVTQIKQDVLDHLDQNINKQELAEGAGFVGFLNKGEIGIEFNAFKQRIEKEFDTLISQLG